MVIDNKGVTPPSSGDSQQTNLRNQQLQQQSLNNAQNQAAQTAKEAPTRPNETVVISDQARVLKKLESEVAKAPEVDSEKVERLAKAIQANTYIIDADRVAKKLLNFDSLLP